MELLEGSDEDGCVPTISARIIYDCRVKSEGNDLPDGLLQRGKLPEGASGGFA